MQLLIRIAIAFLTSTSDENAEALHRFAPNDVSVEQARDHIWAARVAAAIYDVDAETLLAVAWHESRFQIDAGTAEPGHRLSCGVMTPVPHRGACTPIELTALGGYLFGAGHLRVWLRITQGNLSRALLGYAAGFFGLRYCAADEHKQDHLCQFPAAIQIRAAAIAKSFLNAHS